MTEKTVTTKARLSQLTIVGAVIATSLVGCTSSIGAAGGSSGSQSGSGLAWGPCTELSESVDNFTALVGAPLGFEEYLPQLECAQIEVPLDYDNPDGRQIDIAISRIAPSGSSAGYLFTNPGGPGLEGRTMPATLMGTPLAPLAKDFTLIGIDPRGTGGSTSVACSGIESVEPYDDSGNEIAIQDYAQALSTANKECFDSDPDFFTQVTTQNAARDMDRVQEALGADQVDFLAASWGTELGMSYLAQFPDNTQRMLLDSISDPTPKATEIYETIFAAKVRHPQTQTTGLSEETNDTGASDATEDATGDNTDTGKGTETGTEVASDGQAADQAQSDESLANQSGSQSGAQSGLPALPENLYQPFSASARLAYTCNGVEGAADEQAAWNSYQTLTKQDPQLASDRIEHPISSEVAGIPACAGWPLSAEPITLAETKAELQLIGHSQETVTPVEWAKKAHELIGGNLFIIDDDVHSSALTGPYAPQIVQFFLTGQPLESGAQSGESQSGDTQSGH